MTRAVKWGIVSTADINRAVLAGAAESDEVDIMAVGSRSLARAEEYAGASGIERAYGTYDGLLADPDVEAVYISLPNSMHVEWSIRALEAGKHVLCEKPFSRHAADVERAFDVAETAALHLSEAFMYRHHPQAARLGELVASGAIGELRVIRASFSYSLYDTGNIRLSPELEGGSLMDVGCYCVSGARLLAGEPVSVTGTVHTGSTGTDAVFTGLMRFPGDVTALFHCGTSLPDSRGLEAVGTDGSIFLSDPWSCHDPVIELRRKGAIERIEVAARNPYRLELEDMNAAIRGERLPLLGRADALGQARTIDALFRSAAGNESVEV
ncbi:MAG: Gfo/Idh/MocA family oxidoreductase [Thermoleophilia bacterium]|nr:Gfo/Idh/MocA family oxidoreductase [Thermoleophilia bacterium]